MICLWLAGSGASTALGETFHVSTDGSDFGGTGSAGSPWRTITHAVDQVDGGDLILVRPGIYNGRQSLRAVCCDRLRLPNQMLSGARMK